MSARKKSGSRVAEIEKILGVWPMARVGDVGQVQLGRQRAPKHAQGDHMRPYLRVANVYEDRIDLYDVLEMNFTPKEFETFALQPGDILLNEGQSLEWVGRPAMYRGELPGACFQNTLVRFRPGPQVDGRYALLVFRWFLHGGQFQAIAKWTTNIAHLGAGRFAEMQMPLPPLPEQRRIVAEIEAQFTKLDAGVAALKRVQANLKRYRAAVLKAACEGTWARVPISRVIRTMDQGWSPKCETVPSAADSTWAVIRTTAIQGLRFLENENKALPSNLAPRKHLELQSGDLLVTRAGPRSRVGIACLVKATRPRLMLCDKAYRIRVIPSVAHAAYVELVLNAPHVLDEVDKLKSGISDSGLNLTQKRFADLQIPLPPPAEQTRIVAEVERRLSVIDELETIVATNLARATRLRQAVLQQAFNGRRHFRGTKCTN